MVTLQALANVKDYFTTYVPDTLILDACTDADHHWRQRQRGPVVTTYLFLKQLLHSNTACTHLRHLSGMPVNPSAYCQARARLPLSFFQALQRRVGCTGCSGSTRSRSSPSAATGVTKPRRNRLPASLPHAGCVAWGTMTNWWSTSSQPRGPTG